MIQYLQCCSSARMRRIAISVFVAMLAAPSPAQQQVTYSWPQIEALFLRSNPVLQAQEQSIASDRAAEVTAGLRPNPTLENDTTSSTVGVYQEFEIGGKRRARIHSAKLTTQIAKSDAADTRRMLLLNLRQAFVAALQAKSDLQFAQENLADYENVIEINRKMYQQGQISRGDFLRIELQMLDFQSDLDDAMLEMKTARATLRGLLGTTNLPGDFEPAGELKAYPFEKDLDELKNLALENRPDLKSAETGQEKAAADVRLAKTNRWPDPTVGVSYLHAGNEMPGPDWFQPFYPKGTPSNGLGIGIASIPIPLFNRNQGEIARTRSEELRSGFLTQAAENQVIQDVETSYAEFVTARNRMHKYEGTYLGYAKESLDIEKFSFQKGGASILDFLDAQRTYRSTQIAYRQQLAAYMDALARLESAAGLDFTP